MTTCKWCKFEWLQVTLWVIIIVSSILAFGLLLVGLFLPNFNSLQFCIFSAVATFLFITIRQFKRHCDRFCLIRDCQCGCHVIRECAGKCHHWCKYKTNVDVEVVLGAEEEEEGFNEGCSDCKWGHELFDDSEPSSLLQLCGCPCHRFGVHAKRQSWRCRCHRWCYAKVQK